MAKREQQTDTGAIPVMPTKTAVRKEESGVPAIPIGQMSVLEDLVRQLEEAIRSARNMPLSSSALVDRKEVLDLIELLKRSIPEEIARFGGDVSAFVPPEVARKMKERFRGEA